MWKKIETAEKISKWKIDVKKILIAGEKILGWNIAVKNSRLVNCYENFWVEKCGEESEIGKKCQGKKLLWEILIGRWVLSSVKKFLAIPPPPPKKLLNQAWIIILFCDYRFFLEIFINYWFFMLLKIYPTHAEWKYLIGLHIVISRKKLLCVKLCVSLYCINGSKNSNNIFLAMKSELHTRVFLNDASALYRPIHAMKW